MERYLAPVRRELYFFGGNPVETVIKRGRVTPDLYPNQPDARIVPPHIRRTEVTRRTSRHIGGISP